MELPPEWRVETAPGFDADLDALRGPGRRPRQHFLAFKFYLERDPFHFSEGLTRPDDDARVITNPDPLEGAEYIAGLWVDRRHQQILLTWINRLDQD